MKHMITAFAFFLLTCSLLLFALSRSIKMKPEDPGNSPTWEELCKQESENSDRWEKVAKDYQGMIHTLTETVTKADADTRAFHEKNYRRQGAIIRALMLRVGPDPIEVELDYPEDECLNLEPLDAGEDGRSFFNMDSKRWRLSITKQTAKPVETEEPGD